MRIITLGYAGRTLAEVQDIMARTGALLVDIRYSPQSRLPQWRKQALQNRLKARYTHLPAFGNRNFRGGPIELLNWPVGLEEIREMARHEGCIILMCACRDAAQCHRAVVAEKLVEAGFAVEEWSVPAGGWTPPTQLMLF